MPDTDRRFVMRVPPQPYLRFDTNDYSLDPRLAGRRVEVQDRPATDHRRSALDTGELVARHRRSFAKHLTFTDPAHQALLDQLRGDSPPRPRGRGRAAPPGSLRRPDPGMSKTSELTHLFRALKAPAAARALPKLAERAREEEWSHERFLEAVLSTEVSSRESHGGESRIKAARFPARKTLEEFDFTFQRSVKKQVIEHLGQLDFLHGKRERRAARPAGDRQDPPGDRHSASGPAWPASGSPSPPPPSGWRGWARQSARAASRQSCAAWASCPLIVVDEVGYIPFDPEAANLMFSLVSARYERASLIVTSNKPFSAWGEIFGDEVVAAAMIDRLVHHAEILALKGDSYRLRDKDLGSPPPRD